MEQIINQYHLTQIKDRKVSYRKIGNGSRKILFFHGFPGSSIQIELFSPLIHVLDLEVLCFDRPGYNETEISESESQYTQVSFIARALLHSFGWTKCEVVSVSGGTPFLFSFLKTSAELVSKVTVMSGLGPLAQKEFMDMMSLKTKIGLKVILAIPGTILKRTILFGLKNRNSNKFNLVRFFMPVANADLKVLQQKKVQLTFSQALQEAFLQVHDLL